jgi:hypothetical protein
MSEKRDRLEFEPLEPPLDDAVRAVLATSVPAEAMLRVQQRAQDLDKRTTPLKQSRYTAYVLGALAAALVLFALVLTMNPHDAWAQVAETMRGKDWVRMTLKAPPSAEIPGDGAPPESWFSAKHRRGGHTFQKRAAFVDLARQETWEYDPAKGTILLSSTRESDNNELGLFGLLMALVVPGEAVQELPQTNVTIEKHQRDEVVVGDRRWIEFTFYLRDPRRKPQPHEFRVTFRVDPHTNLPFETTSTEKMGPNDPARERTYIVDYPPSGPADIYALGAPRTAKVVDRRYKPGDVAELKELFATYNRAWKVPIEPYKATVLHMTLNKRDVHFAYRVEHDGEGTQGRVVDLDRLLAIRNDVWGGKITVPTDAESWWLEQVAALPNREQYLDQMLTPHEVNYPKMTGGIFGSTEFRTPNLDGPSVTVSLDKQPKLGPSGTVLLRVLVEGGGFNDAAYWIAPDRGYQVVRSELRYEKQRKPWDIRVTVVDEIAQSPGGRWYATQTRLGQVQQSGDELPAQAGTDGVSTNLFRYFVEFE